MHAHTAHYVKDHNIINNKFTCLLCKKAFKSRSYLDAHVIHMHTEKKTISCNKCNKMFHYRSYIISNKTNDSNKKTKNKQSIVNKQFTCFHCSRS